MSEQQHTEPVPAELFNTGTDVDLHQSRPVGHRRDDIIILAVIAVGGAVGAVARFLVGETWPTPAGTFPVSTLAINVVGSALIGVLMVLITQGRINHRLLRPFLGIGVLGGFTTFSTYTADIQRLVASAHADTALFYLTLTPISALLAVWVTATATRRLINWRIQ